MSVHRPRTGAERRRRKRGRGVVFFENDPFPVGKLAKLAHNLKDRGLIPFFRP